MPGWYSLIWKKQMLKEYIICSAIDYNGTIICGLRHEDCYKILFAITNSDNPPGNDKQGFITSQNRFVTRKEAYKIAKENNQIRWGVNNEAEILISENLY